MYDKNGKKIKRGCHIRYEGEIYRVIWARFGKIAITDGREIVTLKSQLSAVRRRIQNIEVVREKHGRRAYAY